MLLHLGFNVRMYWLLSNRTGKRPMKISRCDLNKDNLKIGKVAEIGWASSSLRIFPEIHWTHLTTSNYHMSHFVPRVASVLQRIRQQWCTGLSPTGRRRSAAHQRLVVASPRHMLISAPQKLGTRQSRAWDMVCGDLWRTICSALGENGVIARPCGLD